MASVSRMLRRIKDDLQPYLSEKSIEDACHEAGYVWRERKWGPAKTIHLFVIQLLCFNTAMTHLRHIADAAVTAPAYCRARMRLPLAVLQKLLGQSSAAMRAQEKDRGLWCGLRAFLVDGSSTIAPDTTASQKEFGQPGGCRKGCGFPVPKVLALFDAFSGMIVELMAFPLYTHEQSKVWMLHARCWEPEICWWGIAAFAPTPTRQCSSHGKLPGYSACTKSRSWTFARIAGRQAKGKTETKAGPPPALSGGWASMTRSWNGASPPSRQNG
jgi:hypothetical protein